MLVRPVRLAALLCLCLPLLALAPARAPRALGPVPLRVLVVGGGPERAYNQVAIENNVRYVRRLLPAGARIKTLFADGNPQSRVVLYTDPLGRDRYRATTLAGVDGPSRIGPFVRALGQVAGTGNAPLLLYFTGHGSPGRSGYDNNNYDLWGRSGLSVTTLAQTLGELPPQTPVTVVMVQCFSGSFGNLLFAGGSPHGAPINLKLCGFFASTANREAAGCTSEVNEADYHDFTSYFFAALSGKSRVGKSITGADYDHNGTVGMNEAFAYALVHDISIDTPVCTSDVFLRRYVPVTADRALFQTPYADVLAWAQPAPRAALEALSQQLDLDTSNRLPVAYGEFARRTQRQGTDAQEEETARYVRFVRLAKSIILAHRLAQSGDAAVQARYVALLSAEAANPLRPSQSAAAAAGM